MKPWRLLCGPGLVLACFLEPCAGAAWVGPWRCPGVSGGFFGALGTPDGVLSWQPPEQIPAVPDTAANMRITHSLGSQGSDANYHLWTPYFFMMVSQSWIPDISDVPPSNTAPDSSCSSPGSLTDWSSSSALTSAGPA